MQDMINNIYKNLEKAHQKVSSCQKMNLGVEKDNFMMIAFQKPKLLYPSENVTMSGKQYNLLAFASVEENEAINICFKFENGFYSIKDQTLPKLTKLSNLRILLVIYTKEIATQMTSNLEDFIYKKRSLDEMSIQSLKFCDIEKFKTLIKRRSETRKKRFS